MKIEGNTIIFMSDPKNYYKEYMGSKCNTIRAIKKPVEFAEFVDFMYEFNLSQDGYIKIFNSKTGKSFTRTLTDITEFEDYYIFSWRPE